MTLKNIIIKLLNKKFNSNIKKNSAIHQTLEYTFYRPFNNEKYEIAFKNLGEVYNSLCIDKEGEVFILPKGVL